MVISVQEAQAVMDTADCLHDQAAIEQGLDQMAAAITQDLAEQHPLALCVMNGGLLTAGHLLSRLHFPLQVDYLHATRYRGDTTGGATVEWLKHPQNALQGRTVLLIDDILDEGYTLREIAQWCHEQGAQAVKRALLVEKLHDRRVSGVECDYVALQVPDRYVFGFGMDYKEYWRNAPGIYAVSDKE